MKLAYITSTFPFGPREQFLDAEIRAVAESVDELYVAPMRPSGRCRVLLSDLGIVVVERGLFNLRMLWAMAKLAVTAPMMLLTLGRLACRANTLRKRLKNLAVIPKAVWLGAEFRRKGISHIHAHWIATTSTMAMFVSRVSGIPWSCTAHRWDIVEQNLLEAKMASASFVRFISAQGLEMAIERSPIRARAHVIHMGVTVPPRTDAARDQAGKPVVLFCPANLVPVKGHTYLLEAVKLVVEQRVDVLLLVAGDGPERAKLERKVDDLELREQVRFLGHLRHEDVTNKYQHSEVDIAVLPSVDLGNGLHEGIPVSLMEAMSYGVPVVSTRTGGIPELVVEGTGMLVPDKDPQSLASAITTLARSADLRTEMGERGRNQVLRSFDAQQIAVNLLAEVKDAVLSPRGGVPP